MNVVALDGAFGGFSCAVFRDGRLVSHKSAAGNVALEAGLPLVVDTLREAAMTPADLDCLAVGTGPGAFTGLRIAISYAKSLALGWRRPLAGVGSFEALELGLPQIPRLSVISAKPGTASVHLLTGAADHRMSGSTSELCDRIAALHSTGVLYAVGAPEDVLSGLGERGIDVHTLQMQQPPAVAIAQIAASRAPAPSLHAIRADYGEAPPAKVPAL